MATISTHNGSAAHRDHNIRNRNVTDKQPHIDRDGHFEIWHDERLPDAYERIFGDAVKRYNERQQRPERRIRNYLQTVMQNARKHAVYEMIIGVYGLGATREIKRQILKEFVEGWQQRNPNLELIGAYYHADEQGEPHVHIDYVPVAHGYKRGMDTQTGLARALYEQGFPGKTNDDKTTSQIKWQARENQVLERICNAHGVEVEHPQQDSNVKHLDTDEYKRQQLQQEIDDLTDAYLTYSNELLDIQTDLEDTQRWLQNARNNLKLAIEDVESLKTEKIALKADLGSLEVTKIELQEDITTLQAMLHEKQEDLVQQRGGQMTGSDLATEIRAYRAAQEKAERQKAMESFVELPAVAPAFERWQAAIRSGKKKKMLSQDQDRSR